MSRLSRGVSKGISSVASIGKKFIDPFGLLGFGATPGVQNPFGVPDLSFLKDNKQFDFLKNLGSQYKPVGTNDTMFNELIGKINAPSSVDQVQKSIDSQSMQELLDNINTDERNTVGSTKSDFLDRGLGGPGQVSDIEANAIAQNRADANKNRTGARLSYANSELERLKNKENQVVGAYGDRYDTTNKNLTTDANTFNDLLKTGNLGYADTVKDRQSLIAKLMTDLYTGGAKNQIDTAQPGYLDNILRNVKLSVPLPIPG